MNSKLIELLHNISQKDYTVSFGSDFQGMIRLSFTHEFINDFYIHSHLGIPRGSLENLEKELIKELEIFYEDYCLKDQNEIN